MQQRGHAPAEEPVVGPGNSMAVRYRTPDGGEAFVAKLSGPGMPPPFWQVWEEFERLGVPSEAVLAVHSELAFCRLPGCYCEAVLARIAPPDAEFSHSEDYGATRAERAAAVATVARYAARTALAAGQPPPPGPSPVPPPADVPPAAPLGPDRLNELLTRVFGHGAVHRYTPAEVSAAGLAPHVAADLTGAGLPMRIPYLFDLGPLRPMADALGRTGAPHAGRFADLWAFGGDGMCVLGVGADDGRVRAVDPYEGTARFVNGDVAAFARSLALLTRGRQRMAAARDPYLVGKVVAGLQEQLAGIDREALREEDHWWSLIVEQLWHGLL
ncbi:SUKH-4 family immunity protein [Actinomadura namibiensis]|uniref:Uncharacterized protein n=2 Tax=Actinomadura TaxID=1988 RepID=A0A7W3LP81_ACTNM|nr:SUKH-4 family immunity protein [Actinomadura namibiensis]MBA8951816.1 hypothetical protein [Actinomadura namibiensis]